MTIIKDIFPDKKHDLDKPIKNKLNPLFHTNKDLIALDDTTYESQDFITETPKEIIKQELTEKNWKKEAIY